MRQHTLTVPAPAKLNLFLHITGRRADGYHTLQTVFQLIDYCDQLSFSPLKSDELRLHTRNFHEALDSTQNLVWKAAQLLKTTCHYPYGADILLEKNLPAGGGLGGGSSDAASTLITLNHLWQTQLSTEELAQLALQLGADVPVFIYGRNAWAEGVGEQVQAIDLPTQSYLVLVPECHVETAKIFQHKDLTRDSKHITIAAFLAKGGKNDCEDVVRTLYPPVNEAMLLLNRLGYQPRMTGTGACVFSAFPDKHAAISGFNEVRSIKPGIKGFIAQSVSTSPLYERLNLSRH